jgi:hypothetical protein
MQIEISLGRATSNAITGHTTPSDAITDIQSGKWAKEIAALRSATGDEADRLKKTLPAILWAGKFTSRKNSGVEKFSGYLCADIDKVPKRIGELHDTARNDRHAAAAFVSPSGTGIKIVFRVPVAADAKQHQQNFNAVRAHVAKIYNAKLDEAAKDIARLCFVSHDPAAFFNAEAVPLDVTTASVQPLDGAEKGGHKNGTSNRTEIAKRILGAIQWTDDTTGFCKCPGEHLHTTANSAKDCKVMLDGVPTIKCFHGSCAGIVAGANHELRSQIAKAEKPTAPDSNRADIAREYLGEESEQAASEKGFTIRTPDEILAMRFDDSDRMLGDHLLDDGGQLALLGAGGVGKSRLLLLMLACIAGARRFLTFDTFKPEMKWLILQTENSNRRLKDDLAPIKSWLGDDWPRFTEHVIIHTIETDSDAFVNLDDPDAVARIEAAIQKHKPDGIAIDPLADFAAGDLNKDPDMKATLQMLSRVCRRGNPKRAIIVLHHAITGRGGAMKATGYDRASFARNSKMLHAWARGQINLAPVDPDSNDRLIVACGKCSNGREFQTFAVRLNPDTMIYECDPTVDVSQWERDVTGSKDNAPLMNPDRVRELCAVTGSSKAALAKSIMDDCGCYRGSAYRYITRAEQSKKITFNKSHETYFRK